MKSRSEWRVLDLFSGIGGFSLGLERAGMNTVAFCEINPYCRAVLKKHWPEVPCYDDITTLTAERLAADGIAADVICGGFPCQDISFAGKGKGIADGTRSGLWSEYARLIGELRPRYVIVENVAALLNRGLEQVLGDLAALGFDAEWHCIPASAIGAPHRRDRLWIVAHAVREGRPRRRNGWGKETGGRSCDEPERPSHNAEAMADADCHRHGANLESGEDPGAAGTHQSEGHKRQRLQHILGGGGAVVPDTNNAGLEGRGASFRVFTKYPAVSGDGWWSLEPNVGRVAHGVPKRVDRLKALGNAVVPQIPEMIGRAIMEADDAS